MIHYKTVLDFTIIVDNYDDDDIKSILITQKYLTLINNLVDTEYYELHNDLENMSEINGYVVIPQKLHGYISGQYMTPTQAQMHFFKKTINLRESFDTGKSDIQRVPPDRYSYQNIFWFQKHGWKKIHKAKPIPLVGMNDNKRIKQIKKEMKRAIRQVKRKKKINLEELNREPYYLDTFDKTHNVDWNI